MPFTDSHKPQNLDAILVDIDGEEIPDPPGTKEKLHAFKKGVAEFNDGSKLEFPPDVTFAPDNHVPDGQNADASKNPRVQVRLRAFSHLGPNLPSILIPRGVSKQYIVNVIERLEKGV